LIHTARARRLRPGRLLRKPPDRIDRRHLAFAGTVSAPAFRRQRNGL